MKFEVGKTYRVNGGGQIRITKRTKKFVSFDGDFTGRKMIDLSFLSESIWIQKKSGSTTITVPCFAD